MSHNPYAYIFNLHVVHLLTLEPTLYSFYFEHIMKPFQGPDSDSRSFFTAGL